MKKLVRLPEVLEVTGLSKPTIYRMIAEKRFPKQKRIGLRAVAWLAQDIDRWQEQLKAVA